MNDIEKKNLAFVHLLYADDEEDFVHWYKIATERGAGAGLFRQLRKLELQFCELKGIKPEDFTGDMLLESNTKGLSQLFINVCKTCGNKFLGAYSARYCSKECKAARHKKFVKICPLCKKEFTTSTEKKIFCCKKHANIAKNKVKGIFKYGYFNPELDAMVAVCPVCRKEHTLNSLQQFCSTACKKIWEKEERK